VHALDDRRRVLENVHADRTVEVDVDQLPRDPHRRVGHCFGFGVQSLGFGI